MPRSKGTPEKPSQNGSAHPTDDPKRLAAYFLSLTLENVRCFGPKQTLDLSDGQGKPAAWTILLGLNGAGKTTVLQVLAGFDETEFTSATGVRRPDLRLHHHDWRSLLRVHDDGTAPATVAVHWRLSGGLTSDEFQRAYQDSQLAVLRGPNNTTILATGGNRTPVDGLISTNCVAYGVNRSRGAATLVDSGADDPIATLFSDTAELRNPEEWLLQLSYAANLKGAQPDQAARLETAKNLLLEIMPEGEITEIRFASTTGPTPKPRVEFKTRSGWVPFQRLGYGYQTLITWVADLAYRMAERYPDSENPLAEPAVVLVDEIDLHLHPIWQRKLMGFLTVRFPNTQFIATAHSPLVVQAATNANLAVLRWEGDHVVIDNDVDDIRNWRIDQILTSDLFGLETARPPHIEEKLRRRKEILTKSKLSAADKKELAELEAEIGPLPMGESQQEMTDRKKMLDLLETLARERKPVP